MSKKTTSITDDQCCVCRTHRYGSSTGVSLARGSCDDGSVAASDGHARRGSDENVSTGALCARHKPGLMTCLLSCFRGERRKERYAADANAGSARERSKRQQVAVQRVHASSPATGPVDSSVRPQSRRRGTSASASVAVTFIDTAEDSAALMQSGQPPQAPVYEPQAMPGAAGDATALAHANKESKCAGGDTSGSPRHSAVPPAALQLSLDGKLESKLPAELAVRTSASGVHHRRRWVHAVHSCATQLMCHTAMSH